METLVLNASYEPLGFVPWERAITLIFEGKVEIVESYEDKLVRSVTLSFKMPSVIRFLKWVRRRKGQVRFSRDNIYLRDGGRCQYCSLKVARNSYTYDHVLPRSQGGKTDWGNVVVCCVSCNQKKGGRTPEQAKMHLLAKPHKPVSLPDEGQFSLVFRKGMPLSWATWLRDTQYWHGELDEET